MANHAALIRAENPGLAVVARGRNSIHFDMGNGQRRAVLTIDPLHIRNSETEIDATWVADTGAWQYKLAAADFQVNARSVLNAGDVVQWLDPVSGESVILQPLALNWVDNANDSRQQIAVPGAVSATANDSTLTWANGYGAGRHFRYTVHPKRLIKHLIIDSAANLPTPTVANPYLEIEFIVKKSAGVNLYVDGVQWDQSAKTATAHQIEFRVTATGQTAWLFEAPGATDSAGNSTPGIFQLRRQGANRYCTVRIPKAWIDSAVFPIYLDPTFTDGYGGDVDTAKDVAILSTLSTTNWGTGAALFVSSGRAALLRFDVSSVEESAICDSATLYLYNTNVIAGAQGCYIYSIASANAAWAEGTKNNATAGAGESCWNALAADGAGGITTKWAGDAAGDGGADAGCSQSGTDYEATAIGTFTIGSSDAGGTQYAPALTAARVAGWFGTPNTNYGIRMRTNSSADRGVCSSDHATTAYRPKLVVEYTAGGGGPVIPVFMHHYSQLRGL